MKILVVGGAGYLGGAVTDLLLKTDHEVMVYDALLYEDEYHKSVDFVYGDIRDHKKLLPHLNWADAVVWLAALVGDGACSINPDISIEINQTSVEWLSKNYNGRIIFMSTCSVYGAQEAELDEDSSVNPLSVYAVTKFGAEKYLKDKNALIFRLGTLFGISDEFSRVRIDLVVNTMTVKAFYDKKLKVFGGNQYRPLLHVKDAARAIVDNLATEHKGIFNLRSENINIVDLAERVATHFDKLKIEKVPMKFEDSRNYRVKAEKMEKILKFKPKYSVDQGVEEIKSLLEQGRIRDINNPKYINQTHLSIMFDTHEIIKVPKPKEGLKLIPGGLATDKRGQVSFVNDFNFEGVKRFYMVENVSNALIRAWHAHKNEAKYILVVKGAAMIGAVEVDDWDNPSKNLEVKRFILDSASPSVLKIPAGYANGIMSLSKDTQVMIFSNSSIEESKKDDFRFDPRYWDLPIYEDTLLK